MCLVIRQWLLALEERGVQDKAGRNNLAAVDNAGNFVHGCGTLNNKATHPHRADIPHRRIGEWLVQHSESVVAGGRIQGWALRNYWNGINVMVLTPFIPFQPFL